MIVTPKVRGFVCTTAHPEGCRMNVSNQIEYVEKKGDPNFEVPKPKRVLVIGASTGYGLATRIAAMAGLQAATIGVFYEKEAQGKRTASPGYYNSYAFEQEAKKRGIYSKSVNGDAFSDEVKDEVVNLIKNDLGQVDLVVYSLASPRRVDPKTGEKYMSVLKPIGKVYTNKSIDITTGTVSDATIEPANEEEIRQTIKVMGGEDWALWMEHLAKAGVLAEGIRTLTYSYIGPEITRDIYRDGTIGKAKEDLENTAKVIHEQMASLHGSAHVVVAKALVTQASAAIPIVPLYIGALYKVMKGKGTHEGCIEQIDRLFRDVLSKRETLTDEMGRIRIDNYEMDEEVQKAAMELFQQVNSDNIFEIMDIHEYQNEFYALFGFGYPGIDYDKDVEIEKTIDDLIVL